MAQPDHFMAKSCEHKADVVGDVVIEKKSHREVAAICRATSTSIAGGGAVIPSTGKWTVSS